jgi:hypothetical protein
LPSSLQEVCLLLLTELVLGELVLVVVDEELGVVVVDEELEEGEEAEWEKVPGVTSHHHRAHIRFSV